MPTPTRASQAKKALAVLLGLLAAAAAVVCFAGVGLPAASPPWGGG